MNESSTSISHTNRPRQGESNDNDRRKDWTNNKLENTVDTGPAAVTCTLELSVNLCSLRRKKRKGRVRMNERTQGIEKEHRCACQ